jgi:hypothetical protein
MRTNFYNRRESLVGIVIVLVIVGLIGGGLYYYLSKQIPEMVEIIKKPAEEIISPAKEVTPQKEKLDMLIFLSPQYANDIQIKQAINEYIKAVEDDIGWKTEIIVIKPETNNFRKINETMKDNYNKSGNNLKASIMVGEDIDTALKHDYQGSECPSTVPWFTLGKEAHTHPLGKDEYTYPSTGVQSYDSEMKIAVSLLYPSHNLDYQVKSNQIASVFKKFSTDRNHSWNKDSNVFISLSKDFTSGYAVKDFPALSVFGNLNFKIGPLRSEIQESLNKPFMAYFVFGHAAYNTVNLESSSFNSNDLDIINSPLVGIGGCFTDCWPSGIFEDNNILDYSNNKPYGAEAETVHWFTEGIFSSPRLRALIVGAPRQPGNSFMSEALPGLLQGKTIAEAMINHTYSIGDSQTLWGDPTFHYNF